MGVSCPPCASLPTTCNRPERTLGHLLTPHSQSARKQTRRKPGRWRRSSWPVRTSKCTVSSRPAWSSIRPPATAISTAAAAAARLRKSFALSCARGPLTEIQPGQPTYQPYPVRYFASLLSTTSSPFHQLYLLLLCLIHFPSLSLLCQDHHEKIPGCCRCVWPASTVRPTALSIRTISAATLPILATTATATAIRGRLFATSATTLRTAAAVWPTTTTLWPATTLRTTIIIRTAALPTTTLPAAVSTTTTLRLCSFASFRCRFSLKFQSLPSLLTQMIS